MVQEATEQATLRRMHVLRDGGLSYRAVGDVLLEEGRTPRRASVWSVPVLRRILLREAEAARLHGLDQPVFHLLRHLAPVTVRPDQGRCVLRLQALCHLLG